MNAIINNNTNTAMNTVVAQRQQAAIYTAEELFGMINRHELCYNQSTQREFVYNSDKIGTPDGEMTRAGAIIRDALLGTLRIPPVIFWYNTDTNEMHIHDGKQRIMSFYYFCNPGTDNEEVKTTVNNSNKTFNRLVPEDKQKLLNYTFPVFIEYGNSVEEEENFYAINSHVLPLTKYEMLRGTFHGKFTDTFENHLETLKKVLPDRTKTVKDDRGTTAWCYLKAYFGLSTKDLDSEGYRLKIYELMRRDRNDDFEQKCESFDHIFRIADMLQAVKVKLDLSFQVASYIAEKGLNQRREKEVIDIYMTASKCDNDIASWHAEQHKSFINEFLDKGIMLYPRRFFEDRIKYELIDKYGCRCCVEGCNETNGKKLAVDHKIAWVNGGQTILANAQLMCTEHNSRKGKKKNAEETGFKWYN